MYRADASTDTNANNPDFYFNLNAHCVSCNTSHSKPQDAACVRARDRERECDKVIKAPFIGCLNLGASDLQHLIIYIILCNTQPSFGWG